MQFCISTCSEKILWASETANFLSGEVEFPHKVDMPYLVTFCCLLHYTTQIHEVGNSVCPHMYLKNPGSIP